MKAAPHRATEGGKGSTLLRMAGEEAPLLQNILRSIIHYTC